ncbi:MAG: hypothetical protein ACR2N4_13885 [Jatrophihabitans sp.]
MGPIKWFVRRGFDEQAARTAADTLVDSISDELVGEALKVACDRVASEDQTLGNIRTRASAVLSVAALAVTFASSVGLLANDPTHGGQRLSTTVEWTLVAILAVIGLTTSITQLPLDWTLGMGTDAFGNHASANDAHRAALKKLEFGVARNEAQLHRLFQLYTLSLVLLAVEVIVLAIDLAT